jgi:hypothetical protein
MDFKDCFEGDTSEESNDSDFRCFEILMAWRDRCGI